MSRNAGLLHLISHAEARTLDGLFRERLRRSPDSVAYKDWHEPRGGWRDHTWAQIDCEVARWQVALEGEGVRPGERVAMMLRNSPEWVIFDQAALGLGLVTVPLYTQDRPENVAYIINHADCRVLLVEGDEHWDMLRPVLPELRGVQRFLSVRRLRSPAGDDRLRCIEDWLPDEGGATRHLERPGSTLATIVYTSGTTGRPKGVMLSHDNVLSNTESALSVLATGEDDTFLSFLPLSHTFERTCGYYLTIMAGSCTAYARSIPLLGEDLQAIRPTMLISVPRIYERIWGAIRARLDEGSPLRKALFLLAAEVGFARFEHAQGRGPWKPSMLLWPLLRRLVAAKVMARLGGRLRYALSGGAALPPDISRVFIGLGLPILQGYGLTETSPIATANRPGSNIPASVGQPIPGVEVRIGAGDAVLIRGPNVMMGYWNDEEATAAMIQSDGWLNSGDTGRIGEQGHLFITGRLKEIIVLSNGEKVPPGEIEAAIARDPLFEQIMLVGEARPFLSVIAVINPEQWRKLVVEAGLDHRGEIPLGSPAAEQLLLQRIAAQLYEFPGYARVRRASCSFEPWTVENELLTPTMKLRRAKVIARFNAEIEGIYGASSPS